MYQGTAANRLIAPDTTRTVGADWHAGAVRAQTSPFGRLTLVSGPESLLADRAVDRMRRQIRHEASDTELTEVDASRVDAGKLAEATSPSLFTTSRALVVTDLANLAPDLFPDVLALAAPVAELAVILVHGGGPKGKGLLDKLKAAGVDVIDCPSVKTWELPQFVSAEVKQQGASIDSGSAQLLVDAVGHDLRSLAAAVSQLIADGEGGPVTADHIRQYFGGRAEVTSFAVADAALAGRTGVAMEQLHWAISTGAAPVLVTSALAAGLRGLGKLITARGGLRDADLAREVGVPPWKLKSMRAQARGWDQAGLAAALTAVATADADVKGAADDAGFALERAVLAVARARRG
jgi:DNA polymerase-3 subunit delta